MPGNFSEVYPHVVFKDQVITDVYRVQQCGNCFECNESTYFMEMRYQLYVCSSRCLEIIESQASQEKPSPKYNRVKTQEFE